jgi:hypothetical protein
MVVSKSAKRRALTAASTSILSLVVTVEPGIARSCVVLMALLISESSWPWQLLVHFSPVMPMATCMGGGGGSGASGGGGGGGDGVDHSCWLTTEPEAPVTVTPS